MIVASFIWTKHRNVTERQTDRRTDRQTDRAMVITAVVLQAMRTRCKNLTSSQLKARGVGTKAITNVNHWCLSVPKIITFVKAFQR